MSTIPFAQVVNVVPSVLSAGGDAVDLNGLMLTQSSYAPMGQVLSFASQTAVAAYFGAGSNENTLAGFYFNSYTTSTNKPAALLFTRYPETAIAGFLSGGSLAALTLTQLQALSGILTITTAGIPLTSSTITLTGATSFSNAATLIQAAFTSPPFAVTYDSVKSAFIFTTTATGATATMAFATGSLAAGLKLTAVTGATQSNGAAIGVPATFMASILVLNQNWASFMTTWEPIDSEKLLFAAWSNSVQPRFLYVAQDSNAVIASTPNSTTTFNYSVTTLGYVGTHALFGDATHAAFVMGYGASLDFNRLNGRTTLDFRVGPGLVTTVNDSVAYGNVTSNTYNFYGSWGSNNPANNSAWYGPGSVSGSWAWADTYFNQIWLNANLQLAIVKLLQAVNSIPYNAEGYSLVYAACLDPINTAVGFGAIRTGVTLSAAQTAELKLYFGLDPTSAIQQQGFYLQIANASPAVRAARQSPPCTLCYADGGSIQRITLASIEVQ